MDFFSGSFFARFAPRTANCGGPVCQHVNVPNPVPVGDLAIFPVERFPGHSMLPPQFSRRHSLHAFSLRAFFVVTHFHRFLLLPLLCCSTRRSTSECRRGTGSARPRRRSRCGLRCCCSVAFRGAGKSTFADARRRRDTRAPRDTPPAKRARLCACWRRSGVRRRPPRRHTVPRVVAICRRILRWFT